MATDDAERSGIPNSAVNKIVFEDRKLKSRDVAGTLRISEGSVFTV